jgi:flavodoxin short chain
MSCVVVYFSQTGNTEAMAEAIAKGANTKAIFSVDRANLNEVLSYDSIALGCPAMGAEELESGEFEPFMDDLKDSLKDKKVALFGSYDWGDGEWMRTWQEDLENNGISLVQDGLICNNEPESEDLDKCEALGKALM